MVERNVHVFLREKYKQAKQRAQQVSPRPLTGATAFPPQKRIVGFHAD